MIRSILLEGESLRCDLSLEEIAAALLSEVAVLWVDLPPNTEGAEDLMRNAFGIHPLAIEDCFNGRVDTPKIDDYGDHIFIVSQSVAFLGRGEALDLTEVDIFLGGNFVLTSRQRPVPPLDAVFQQAQTSPHMLRRGADFLTHTILDSLVDLLLPAVEEMDEHIDDLEQRILERPDKALLPEVLLLKRNTLRLRRSILPERDLVNRLSRGEYPGVIGNDALIFFRDVYDHIVRIEEMLDGLRDVADGALSSYLSSLNNRMNEVMKAMSVVAVIFLPLTLIASIYGTNLDFTPWGSPGLQGGFYAMLAFMVVVVAALIFYFRRRGWF